MKKFAVFTVFCLVIVQSSAQIYKMDKVWNMGNHDFLMCQKDIETGSVRFSLCQLKYYGKDNTSSALVSYFEGSAPEMFRFLSQVNEFISTYDSDSFMTTIEGRKVYRTTYILSGVYIFEQNGAHFGSYRDGTFSKMFRLFEKFCKKEKIQYEL